jgi:hypothetical protein
MGVKSLGWGEWHLFQKLAQRNGSSETRDRDSQ